jgi:hypothetical protein
MNRLDDKCKSLEIKAMDNERRVITVTQDKDRLSSSLRAKTNEVEELRINFSKLESELIRYQTIENTYRQLQVQHKLFRIK